MSMPNRTVIIAGNEPFEGQMETLLKALRQKLKEEVPEKHIAAIETVQFTVWNGSPGEIRTLVGGSKAQRSQNSASFIISDIDWAVQDFYQYCKIEERLTSKVCNDYKYAARRFLLSCKGEISRQAIRDFLSPYLEKAPKTYNNIIDDLRAFIERYLKRPELMQGFKHSHVPSNYE
jgi:hypothetical protein